MVRLQIRLRGSAEELFNTLVDELKTSPKDVVLDALALLNFAAEQVLQGQKVGSFNPESREFTAMTTPSLESLTRRSREAATRSRSEGLVSKVRNLYKREER